jgi:hypothetical protein
MAIEIKIAQLKEKRNLSLITKKNALDSRDEFQGEIDLNNTYLFEINRAISLWAEHAYLAFGYDTTEPSIRDPNNDFWVNRQEIASTRDGDSSDVISTYGGVNSEAIFPIDSNGFAALELNTNAIVLTTNRPLTMFTDGIYNLIDTITSAAQALYDARTEDLSAPAGPDNPTFWNSTLETAFNNTIAVAVDLINNTRDIERYIDGILNNTNTLITDLNIRNDRPFFAKIADEKVGIRTVFTTIVAFRDFLKERRDYFETGFTTEQDRTTDLLTLISDLNAEKPFFETRKDDALNIIGSDIENDFTKYRYFWLDQNIGKPLGPQFALNSFLSSIEDSTEQEEIANGAFDIFLIESDEWITTPEILSVVSSDDNTSLVLSFLGTLFANKYRVYRNEVTPTLKNTIVLGDSTNPIAWHVTPNEEQTFVEFSFTDSTVEHGKNYLYRIQTFDTREGDDSIFDRTGSINSSSLQSDIIPPSSELIHVDSIVNGVLTTDTDLSPSTFYLLANNKVIRVLTNNGDNTYNIDDNTIELFETNMRLLLCVGRIRDE